ncbi:MAG: SIMPL domain-containing protein [Bacteroidota bacterium]|nr:SIMPL domain-containing protein [Bacteroidota bacterium]
MKKTKQTVAKCALLLMATFLFFISSKAQNNIPVQRTITAAGNAKIEVTPDEIYVAVYLREYDKKGNGKVDIVTIKNNFLSACKSMGLNDTDVVVQSYQGYDGTIYQYKKNKKQNPDLKAGINYWVKVNSLKRMDELVNKLDDEATQNFYIAKTDYSKREELALKMKEEAIKAAKEKAIALAAAINEKIGGAVTINEPTEVGDYSPRPMFAMAKMASSNDNEPAMNVDFKKMKIEYEANVTFALL